MQAALENWRTAPIPDRTRAMLGFIERLTLSPEHMTWADAKPLRDAGLGDAAIEDAVHVCVLFSIYDRLADSFRFDIPEAAGFEQSAARLLRRGYA